MLFFLWVRFFPLLLSAGADIMLQKDVDNAEDEEDLSLLVDDPEDIWHAAGTS